MQTVKIDNNRPYRIEDSAIIGKEELIKAFAAFGIADYVNARAPYSKTRFVQLFIMDDGSAQIADSRIVQKVVQSASKYRI